MRRLRSLLIWVALAAVILGAVAAAAASPLLAWREPVYIMAGFAGIAGLALILIQPLLAAGYLPGLAVVRGRRVHRWTGALLVLSVLLHVGGLWITSPPDVVDALLIASPTPFSVWGVIAMWAIFATALLAALRRRLRLSPRLWRRAHTVLGVVVVAGTVVHAVLIDGTMETMSKILLCALAVAAMAKAVFDLRAWARRPRRQA